MIRFLLGSVLGAVGMLYFLAALLPASREDKPTTSTWDKAAHWYPSVWGTHTDVDPQWTYTWNSPAT